MPEKETETFHLMPQHWRDIFKTLIKKKLILFKGNSEFISMIRDSLLKYFRYSSLVLGHGCFLEVSNAWIH